MDDCGGVRKLYFFVDERSPLKLPRYPRLGDPNCTLKWPLLEPYLMSRREPHMVVGEYFEKLEMPDSKGRNEELT